MTVIKPRDEATAMQMIEIALSAEQKAAIGRVVAMIETERIYSQTPLYDMDPRITRDYDRARDAFTEDDLAILAALAGSPS